MALFLFHVPRFRSSFFVFATRARPFCVTSVSSSSSNRPSAGSVTLGDVTLALKEPESAELVPTGYLNASWDQLPQSHLRHIKWLMQKEAIGQDVFLIGPPGDWRIGLSNFK